MFAILQTPKSYTKLVETLKYLSSIYTMKHTAIFDTYVAYRRMANIVINATSLEEGLNIFTNLGFDTDNIMPFIQSVEASNKTYYIAII